MFIWNNKSRVYVNHKQVYRDYAIRNIAGSFILSQGYYHCDLQIVSDIDASKMLGCIYSAIKNNREFLVIPSNMVERYNVYRKTSKMRSLSSNLQKHENKRCFQVLSGGSTGNPKRVRRTCRSWMLSILQNVSLFNLSSKDSYTILGRLSHSLALYAAIEALNIGANLHLLASNSPRRQLAIFETIMPTVIYATPAQLRLLISATNLKPSKVFKCVRLVMIGGSKLNEQLEASCRALFPSADVIEFYGSAETSFVAITGSGSPSGSVGKAYPDVDIYIKTFDQSSNNSPHQGEIWVESPYLFEGYVNDIDLQKNGLSRGWFTGEIGHCDDEGNLFITGRKDRMVTIADINIYPEQVENYLMRIEGVQSAYVYPVQDDLRGNIMHATLYVSEFAPCIDDINAQCRSDLNMHACPRKIELIYDLPPLRHSGKLKHRYMQFQHPE